MTEFKIFFPDGNSLALKEILTICDALESQKAGLAPKYFCNLTREIAKGYLYSASACYAAMPPNIKEIIGIRVQEAVDKNLSRLFEREMVQHPYSSDIRKPDFGHHAHSGDSDAGFESAPLTRRRLLIKIAEGLGAVIAISSRDRLLRITDRTENNHIGEEALKFLVASGIIAGGENLDSAYRSFAQILEQKNAELARALQMRKNFEASFGR